MPFSFLFLIAAGSLQSKFTILIETISVSDNSCVAPVLFRSAPFYQRLTSVSFLQIRLQTTTITSPTAP